MSIAIKVEHLSKIYRLGEIGTGTISHDIHRWLAIKMGKEDPFLKIGETNDRTKKGSDVVYSLKDLNFEIEKGDAVGVIGRNGAGKSTLLKILSRVTSPTTGRINIKGRVASLLEVGTGFHPELTGRENIFLNGAILGMRRKEIMHKLDAIIDFSGVERYIDTPVKRYSSGMYVRLAFAVAAHLESEILVVDEVLAVGDAEFQKKCLGKMNDVSKSDGRTILFVSHNLQAVKKLCNKGVFLSNGTLKFEGPVKNAIDKYLEFKRDSDDSGIIPKGVSTYNTGLVRVSKCILLNQGKVVYYSENIKIRIVIESDKHLSNVFVDIRINSSDYTEVSHSSHLYETIDKQGVAFKKGESIVEAELINNFQPGLYNLTVGVHKLDGATLDYVEFICQFEILGISHEGSDFMFPEAWDLGRIRNKSIWKFL
jgi:lipopolysaccharide transport system ATP-binding protein